MRKILIFILLMGAFACKKAPTPLSPDITSESTPGIAGDYRASKFALTDLGDWESPDGHTNIFGPVNITATWDFRDQYITADSINVRIDDDLAIRRIQILPNGGLPLLKLTRMGVGSFSDHWNNTGLANPFDIPPPEKKLILVFDGVGVPFSVSKTGSSYSNWTMDNANQYYSVIHRISDGDTFTIAVVELTPPFTLEFAEDMIPANVMGFIRAHSITSVDSFVKALPPLHKTFYTIVHKSQSPAHADVTKRHPRVVSFGAGSRNIYTWLTDKSSSFANTVEFLEHKPAENRWEAGVIDFSQSPPVLTNPTTCETCHTSLDRPLWAQRDVRTGHDEDLSFDNSDFYNIRYTSNSRLKPLARGSFTNIGPDVARRTIPINDPNSDRIYSYNFHWDFGTELSLRHAQIVHGLMKQRANYGDIAKEAMCADGANYKSVLGKHNVMNTNLHHLAKIATGEFVGGTPRDVNTFIGGNANMIDHVTFLIMHDLYLNNEDVREVYQNANNVAFFKGGNAVPNFRDGFYAYRKYGATAEDELLAMHNEFFVIRDNDAIAAFFTRSGQPRYRAVAINAHVGTDGFREDVCGALTPPEDTTFDIELVFDDEVSERDQNAARAAADRWEEIITGPLDDIDGIDELRINVAMGDLPEGAGGSAVVTRRRSGNKLPLEANVKIKRGLDRTNAQMERLLRHEIGHALGIGQTWYSLVQDISGRTEVTKKHFTGTRAIAAFNSAGGRYYKTFPKIPLGLNGDHWSSTVMAGELMCDASGGTAISAITVQALADLGYTVDVSQADDYDIPLPVISIVPRTRSIPDEGDDARFIVTANKTPGKTITINLSTSETGDMIDGTPGTTVGLAHNATGVGFDVDTEDDSSDESNSVITVTIQSGDGYIVSPDSTASITVRDNDTVSTLPVISVSAQSDGSITEGENVLFSITSNSAPSENLDINLSVSETGDMLVGGSGTSIVVISAGSTSRIFSTATKDDATDESDSVVTLTVQSGSGYTADSNNRSVNVTVQDNDDAPPPATVTINSVPVKTREVVRALITAGSSEWYNSSSGIGSISSDSDMTVADGLTIRRVRWRRNEIDLQGSGTGAFENYFGSGDPGENASVHIVTPYGNMAVQTLSSVDDMGVHWMQWDTNSAQQAILSQVSQGDKVNLVIAGFAKPVTINSIPAQTGEVVRALITVGTNTGTWYRKSTGYGTLSSDSDVTIANDLIINRIRWRKNEIDLQRDGAGAFNNYFGSGNDGENAKVYIVTPYSSMAVQVLDSIDDMGVHWMQWDTNEAQQAVLSQVRTGDLVNLVIAGF